MRRYAALALLTAVPLLPAHAQTSPAWSTSVLLPATWAGEPATARSPDGSLVVAAMRTDDGTGYGGVVVEEHGGRFGAPTTLDESGLVGDLDVAVSSAGTRLVALAGYSAEIHVCRREQDQPAFSGPLGTPCSVVALGLAAIDRPWLTALGDGSVMLSASDIAGNPVAVRSTDDGRTWHPCGAVLDGRPEVAAHGTWGGRPVAVGTLGAVMVLNDRLRADPQRAYETLAHRRIRDLYVARTVDACATWTLEKVSGDADATAFTPVAVDHHGATVVVSAEPHDVVVRTDAPAGWHVAARLRAPGTVRGTFPALATARDGLLAVGWYGGDASSRWRYYVATSRDRGRHWSVEAVSGVVFEGVPWDEHSRQGTSGLGDLSALAFDSRHRLVALFARDTDTGDDVSEVLISRRSAGR